MIANTLLAATRIVKSSVPSNLIVTWANDTTTLNNIFEMRYNAMVRNNPSSPSYSNIDHGNSMYDDLDFSAHTKHISVIRDGRVISAARFVNGKYDAVEAESCNWYNVRGHHPEIGTNFMEPSRLAIDPKYRGSYLLPLMSSHALCMAAEENVDGFMFMTNARAANLISHYTKIAAIDILTETPIKISKHNNGVHNDYIFCHVPLMSAPYTMPGKIISSYIGYNAIEKTEMLRDYFKKGKKGTSNVHILGGERIRRGK